MPLELDNQDPEMGAEPTDTGAEMGGDMGADPAAQGPVGGHGDQEGAMAKQELMKLANYATNLQEHIQDDEELEAWVQSKITIAATNIASVYHYLAYEKKIGEYGEALDAAPMSEGKKRAIKNWLMEAKMKVKELKQAQATKVEAKKEVKEGRECACTECGGTGVVMREYPDHVKAKAAKYNKMTKAMHAASKRLDANHNGIPDDEEMEEGFEAGTKPGTTKKTRTGVMTKTSTGVKHTNTSHSDEEHGEPVSKVKARSAADKAGEKAMDKQADKDYKAAKKANPEGVRRYSLGKQVDEAAPSAGLSKEKKSATVKKAKAGGDIGKPGKGFDKLAKKASGGEKGEKIAAAAMWKNIKETTSYIAEKAKATKPDYIDLDKDGDKKEPMKKAAKDKEVVKESTDLARMRQLMTRLNG